MLTVILLSSRRHDGCHSKAILVASQARNPANKSRNPASKSRSPASKNRNLASRGRSPGRAALAGPAAVRSADVNPIWKIEKRAAFEQPFFVSWRFGDAG